MSLRVIDARSGNDVREGDTIQYPEGEWWTLQKIEDRWLLGASVLIMRGNNNTLSCESDRVRLRVRFLHPNFLFQRVGFFPS